MKTRKGFVSNSSSSSFIIAVKKGIPCPHCGRKDPDFEGVLQTAEHNGCSDDTKLTFVCTDAKDINRHLSDGDCTWWFQDEPDKAKDLKDKMVLWLHNDYKIIAFDLCYHDNTTYTLIENLISSKNAVVLFDSEDKMDHLKGIPQPLPQI